jgi:death-on-curing protein
MKQPVFLSLKDVLALHADQIEQYGGSHGVRDLGLLQSALAMPEASFGGAFLHGTIEEMASAYLYHIAQNHPFIDGNKRIALMATLAFVELNGLEIEAPDRELGDLVLGVAGGKVTKAEAAVFLKKHLRRA